MNQRRGLLVILLFGLLGGGNLLAQNQPQSIPAPFATGQAARLVLGQQNFTDITGGTSQYRWGAISGLAIAGNKLIVADSSFLSPPNNNRVLIYNDLRSLKARLPQDELPAADVVLGQPDFTSSSASTTVVTAKGFNQPVGVASDGTRLFVADFGYNRVLIYNQIPETSGAPADIVIGQKDFTTSAFSAGAAGLRRPNSVSIDGNRLMIADTLNNRVLIFNSVPTANGASADLELGQPNFDSFGTQATSARSLLSPMSITTDGQRLIVADQGNNRVLIYNSIPTQSGAPADVVVGQPNFTSNAPGNTQTTLDFPRYAYSDGTRLLIVDTGNNRILIYNEIPTQNGAAADIVIGQNDFLGLTESCAASNLAIPYAVVSDGDMLFVSDGSNRRILGFRPGPALVFPNGVVNGASFSAAPQTEACAVTLPQPPVAPGAIAAIFGSNLADTTAQAGSLPLPTQLGGVRVKFNGIDAPLFSVAPNQINVQVPFELTGYSASMEIEKDAPNQSASGKIVSAAVPVGLANGAPGLFSSDGSGVGLGMIYHGDSTPVDAANPAKPGETLAVYATGLGTVDQYVVNGAGAQFGAQGGVTIGGTPSAGQTATIVIQDVPYSYTTVSGDSLDQVTSNLAQLINDNDPLVSATVDIANEKVSLLARKPGDDGTNITYTAFAPAGSTLTASVDNPVAVPGDITFSGTLSAAGIVTVTLATTPYTYTPAATDSVATVINNLVEAMSADVNVLATADVANSKIHLELRDPESGLQVTYSVDVEPPGIGLAATTGNSHLRPGVAKVINTVTATIGKAVPLVPGSIFFGGTAEPGQTVTVKLQDTSYPYTTVEGDTLQTVVTKVTAILNGDPNVTATADLPNLKIDLALKNAGAKITFEASAPFGQALIVAPQSATTTNSESAAVTFAGLVKGSVGLYQVIITLPSDLTANSATILTLTQNLIVFGSTTSTNIISNEVTFPVEP